MLERRLPDGVFRWRRLRSTRSPTSRAGPHARLFASIAGWLLPGGVFLACLGAGDLPDWTGEWLGVPMFFSSYDAATNKALLAKVGLPVQRAEVVSMREPRGRSSSCG